MSNMTENQRTQFERPDVSVPSTGVQVQSRRPLIIYTIVFGTIMRIPPPVAGNGELKSVALFLFSALIVWNFFNGVVVGSMGALIGAGGYGQPILTGIRLDDTALILEGAVPAAVPSVTIRTVAAVMVGLVPQ